MSNECRFRLSGSNKTGVMIGTIIFAVFSAGGLLLFFIGGDGIDNRVSSIIVFLLCGIVGFLYSGLMKQGARIIDNDLYITAVNSKFGLIKTKKYYLNEYNSLVLGSLTNLGEYSRQVTDKWLTDQIGDLKSTRGSIIINFYGYLKGNNAKELFFLGGLSKGQIIGLKKCIQERGLTVDFIEDKIENILNN